MEENRSLKEEAAGLRAQVAQLHTKSTEQSNSMSESLRSEVRLAGEVTRLRAELQGGSLREAELQQQASQAAAQLKAATKKLAAAEGQRKKAAEERAEALAQLAARDAEIARVRDSYEGAQQMAAQRLEQVAATEAASMEGARLIKSEYDGLRKQKEAWELEKAQLLSVASERSDLLARAQGAQEALHLHNLALQQQLQDAQLRVSQMQTQLQTLAAQTGRGEAGTLGALGLGFPSASGRPSSPPKHGGGSFAGTPLYGKLGDAILESGDRAVGHREGSGAPSAAPSAPMGRMVVNNNMPPGSGSLLNALGAQLKQNGASSLFPASSEASASPAAGLFSADSFGGLFGAQKTPARRAGAAPTAGEGFIALDDKDRQLNQQIEALLGSTSTP